MITSYSGGKMRISKILISILTAFALLSFIATAYCQDSMQTVSGSVSYCNSTSQSLAINYTDQTNIIQNIQLVISEDIEIFDVPSLSSLQIGDDISVDYIVDEFANNVVISLYKFTEDSAL